MKTKLQLGNIKVEEIGLDISNVTVEAEYDIKEMFQIVDLMKHMTASIPEILENLANAYLTFEDASEHIARVMSEDEEENEECTEAKRRKEAAFEDTLKEVREVSEENALREEREEILAEIKDALEKQGMPEFLQKTILDSIEEDIKAGRAVIKRK